MDGSAACPLAASTSTSSSNLIPQISFSRCWKPRTGASVVPRPFRACRQRPASCLASRNPSGDRCEDGSWRKSIRLGWLCTGEDGARPGSRKRRATPLGLSPGNGRLRILRLVGVQKLVERAARVDPSRSHPDLMQGGPGFRRHRLRQVVGDVDRLVSLVPISA